ncbi:carboxypeptidase-like regulatory domain-containing protein [Polaribacter aquimarinus]|uniref:TonB-dependent receptor n=1 Tax=Polaribacter aquimarinus TaxID=2100726 RepID=A0A2U2JCK5_9FLAO|nr:carboxypeptidase-like regulatory domain-containing protein [Polaribacter aquimarinus]PWG06076.1 TonB-dependent receptor [Polaribacter aquimarinus]
MKKNMLFTCILLCLYLSINSQNTVKGIVADSKSKRPLTNVFVSIKNNQHQIVTSENGVFFLKNIKNGSLVLQIKLTGYETQNLQLDFSGKPIDLGIIYLFKDITEDLDLSLITITDDELNNDASTADNISGLLQASRDVFLRSAAFEFSSSFFRVKGLDSSNGKVLINGIEMNKLSDGRAQWSNWGGLNDILRNQELSNGLAPSHYTFGGVLGSTNINTRASEQSPGARISYSSSNRSYVHRLMTTYSTGVLKKGWSFSFSGSKRLGVEGFNEGTTYNAYSLFASVDKKINRRHSLSFSGFFTPNRRGKSSPNTQEVFDLKGITYNDYWGFLNGRKTNARIKEVSEPILMLNHYWNLSEKTNFQTNIAYQFGKIGNSRIDFNGGANPSPTYYQYLPSFEVRNNDLAEAYLLQQRFIKEGQIDWNNIFDANVTNKEVGNNNAYVLYEDRTDDKQLTINTILNIEINDNITLSGKIEYRRLRSNAFAKVIDLLGGSGYLDINPFAEKTSLIDKQQNNLINPNRVVEVGQKFKYNYNVNSSISNAFLQAQFNYNKVDFYSAFSVSRTSHQREGLYKNGRFENNSLGESKKLSFTNFGLKGGLTYKITGRHLINANIGYLNNAPTVKNSFSNIRENNNTVDNLQSEKTFTSDLSYILRSPLITSKLTTYYISIRDATEISFYFADGVGGDNTAFVQEILNGINKKHIGFELGIEAKITPTIKLKGVTSIGQFTYDNNPNLYLTSDVAGVGGFDENFRSKDYIALLKNFKVASGPQTAYSVGFEYRDPDYWWVGATVNFFANTYIDLAPLNRSSHFYEDADGLSFNDYDTVLARELLQQEKFDNYRVVNLVGGKSWKIGDKYVSVFATINNLFGEEYKSGGFEQGRNANYRQLRDDNALETPVFGNRYWYGRGATYFLNINLRF